MKIKNILLLFSLFVSSNLISKSYSRTFKIYDGLDEEIDDTIKNEIDDTVENEIDDTVENEIDDPIDSFGVNYKCVNDIIFGGQELKNECCDSLNFKCQNSTLTEM